MKKKSELALAFMVGATGFAAHAGGGYATGNQANTYFVSFGWVSLFSAILAMVILALTVREGQILWNRSHANSYKELFAALYHPYDKLAILFDIFYDIMILMVVASCIAGAASAFEQYMGIPYHMAALGVAVLVLFLSIFGANLIRKVSTYMGMIILVLSILIYSVGLMRGTDLLSLAQVDFQAQGFAQLPKAIFNAVTYAGFQWVTIPGVLACGTVLQSKKACDHGMYFNLLFNCLGLGLSVLMLFSWQSYFTAVEGGTTLPTLTVLMSEGMHADILVLLYCIVLLLCMISSAVVVVFGFINRFEGAKVCMAISNTHLRRGAIAVFIMGLSMFISFAGLTNIVKFGYGYCGYFAVAIVIVPLLTVGVYKNRKYLKEHPEQLAAEEKEKAWNLCEE